MQLITAPSKTQLFNGRAYAEHTLPCMPEKTKILIDQLKSMGRKELALLMKTSEKLTESTFQKIRDFVQPFTLDNAKQALFTFQGDAYSAIPAEQYSKEQLCYAQKHLFILSGLYGILRPLDLMQPYRLEMGSRLAINLATGEIKNLYQFWRENITDTINLSLATDVDGILINLASQEYSKVIDQKKLQGKMVTITFKQLNKGELKVIPIHAKKARGLMIHFAISRQLDNAAALKDFRLNGYSYSKEDSTETEWFFFRLKE